MDQNSQPKLLRILRRWDLTAISLNTIIGSGIFLLPATAASMVGVWAPLSFVACGVIMLLFVLSFAEAGSRFSETGGPYLYANKAFGDFLGFEVGWIFWLSRLAAVGANYSVFMTYLGYFFPGVSTNWTRAGIITLIAVTIALANIRGIRVGSFITNSFTVAKLAPLILFVLVGLFFMERGAVPATKVSTYSDFMRSILLLAFALGGFEVATLPAGEANNPQKHLPQALLISVLGATLLYALIQLVAGRLYPGLSTSVHPLADAAESAVGPIGGSLISIGALLSTFGYLFGSSLAVPRLTFALAEQRQFPRIFAKIHPSFRTPWFSILFHVLVTWFLAVLLSFLSLVIINVMARLIVFGFTCGAVIRFRKILPDRPVFRIPGGSTIPLLGILLVVGLLFQSTRSELLYGFLTLIIGSLFYFALKRYTSQSP